MAEKVGFEPTRRVNALRDFESRLFDHLSTSPYEITLGNRTQILYTIQKKKSRCFFLFMGFLQFFSFFFGGSKEGELLGLHFAWETFRFRLRNAAVQTARNISERRKLRFNLRRSARPLRYSPTYSLR